MQSSPDSLGSICPRCSWKSMPVPALRMNSPTSAKGPHGWRTCPSVSVRFCSPKPVISDSNRWCASDVAALTRGRLNWVQQNYIRAETLTRANATLVDTQSTIALAQAWGGGEVASADGLRFVVPIRTINAGPNRKYSWRRSRRDLLQFHARTNSPASMPSSFPGRCAIRCTSSMACWSTRRSCDRWKS